MAKPLSKAKVDSDDDSSRSPSASPAPKASKSKKRAKVESDSEDEEKTKVADSSDEEEEKPKKKSKKPKKAVKGEHKEAREDSGSPKVKDRGKGKKTKSFKAEVLKNDDGDSYFDLGNNKRATVRKFKNNIQVDIRETYSKDGKDGLPGKKGISLNLQQFDRLTKCFDGINEEIDEIS